MATWADPVLLAVALVVLAAAIFIRVRDQRRVRRGLCQKCSYPAGTSPVCTECGAALPRALTRNA